MTQNLQSLTESSFGIMLISAILLGIQKGNQCFGTSLLSKLARLARQSQELSGLLSISSLLGCLLSFGILFSGSDFWLNWLIQKWKKPL